MEPAIRTGGLGGVALQAANKREEFIFRSTQLGLTPVSEGVERSPEPNGSHPATLWKQQRQRVELTVTAPMSKSANLERRSSRPSVASGPVHDDRMRCDARQPGGLDVTLPVRTARIDEEDPLALATPNLFPA